MRRVATAPGIAIILLCALFVEHKASADTIWVEASTHIDVTIDGYSGGKVQIGLFNDLNQSLRGETVRLDVFDGSGKRVRSISIQIANNGFGKAALMLDAGDYHLVFSYKGHDGYRDTSLESNLTVKRCHCNTRLIFPTQIWPAAEKLKFDIVRDVAECGNFAAEWMVTAAQGSEKVRMEPGIARIPVSIDAGSDHEEIVEVEAVLNEALVYEPETVQSKVLLYRDLFTSLTTGTDEYGAWVQAQLALHSEMLESVPVRLTLTDENGEEQAFLSSIQKESITFKLGDEISGCYKANIQRYDLWPEYGSYAQDICIPEILFSQRRIRWIVLIGVIAFVAMFILIKVIRRIRLRPRLPDPRRWATVSRRTKVSAWPKEITESRRAKNANCVIVCVDDQSGKPLAPSEIEISIQTQDEPKVIRADKWPVAVRKDTEITIHTPDYMTWQGTLKSNGRHVLRLKKRRDYVITCFEIVCAALSGKRKKWGYKTPRELYEDTALSGLLQRFPQLNDFCKAVETAAFSELPISDAAIEQIVSQSKALSRTKNRL